MSNVTAGTITVKIAGQDVGLADLLTRINQQMAASGQTINNYSAQMQQLSPAVSKADQALARYTTSLAAVAQAQGNSLASQQLLAQGLAQLTPATTAANTVTLALQKSINAEALAAEKDALAIQKLNQIKGQTATISAGTSNAANDQNVAQIATLGRLVTAYAVAKRAAAEFADTISAGNELEKTLTTFRVLSGSPEQYAHNLALAKAQQDQFGGSLNDTVDGMSNFANLANRTGIEIDQLTKTARALAIVDPAQGFKGAGIALKEFFSGEVTSLARRFEIPREALNGLEKIADMKDRFAALQQVLEQYGISQELITAQADTTAVAFDKLSGKAADAKAAIGGLLANALAPEAKALTEGLTDIANGMNALATKSDQLKGFTNKIFDQTSAKGVDAFNEKIRQTNDTINSQMGIFSVFAGHLQEVTAAEYAYVQALIARGATSEQALAALDANRVALKGISDELSFAATVFPQSADAVNQLNTALLEEASTSAEAQAFALGLAQAVADGLPVEQAFIALQQFKANQLAITNAALAENKAQTEAALTAEALFTQELTNNAAEAIVTKAQGDALKLTQEQLYNAALLAAQGMGATKQSAEILAGQFNITAGAAFNLIAALSQLEVAKAKQALGVQPGGANEREDRLGSNEQIIARAKEADLAKKLAEVQRANALAAASATEKVGLEKDALGRLNKGTVEYEQQLGKVAAAERALAAEQERKAKKNSGAPKLTPNEKINTKLLDDQDKFNDKFEDAEQKHWDKVADIYAKFNDEQQKQFAKNEVSKRRSRADFYAGLQDAPAGVDTQKFAAQYEQAFAKAQEIASTGKAKLANEFLELRQKQIEEMKSLDEEAAKITSQQKEGKISKKDADAQLEFLAGRKKLIEDAQAEEQALLLKNGDDNVNKLNEQLTAEEQAYNDNVDKVALAASRKADAVITHAARSKIAVNEENKALAEQEAHYRRIAALNGGQVPVGSQTAAQKAPTSAGDENQNKPVEVSATSAIPVTTEEGLLVRQAELFLVHDADVMASIGDMAARLEGKLGQVIEAVNNASGNISTAVGAVRDAVGRIKLSSTSVVGN